MKNTLTSPTQQDPEQTNMVQLPHFQVQMYTKYLSEARESPERQAVRVISYLELFHT